MPENNVPGDANAGQEADRSFDYDDILGDESFIINGDPEEDFLFGDYDQSAIGTHTGLTKSTPKRGLIWHAQRLSDVVIQALRWLWEGYLPIAYVVIFYGAGGVGKTTAIMDIIAPLTTGRPFPDGSPNKHTGTVVYITGEDGVADTLLPRLQAAGGDASKVVVLDGIFTYNNQSRALNLSDQTSVDCLEEKLRDFPDLVLLVIDPITSFMGDADTHKTAGVRGCLTPLIRIAKNLVITVIYVHHCNKSISQNAAHRASGSTAFIDAVRTAIMCYPNPDDPKNRRILSVTKSNLAKIPPGIGYTLCAAPGSDVAHVEWESERIDLSADELLSTGQNDDQEASAEDFLRELLADGPMAARDVMTASRDNGYSSRRIRCAFEKIGGKPRKGDFRGGWVWELPGETKIPQDGEDVHS